MKSNTIAAIATPMTNSGIGIIRISGDEALDIIEKVFRFGAYVKAAAKATKKGDQ